MTKNLNIEPKKFYSGRTTLGTTPAKHTLLIEAALKSDNRLLDEWMSTVLNHEVEHRVSF